MYIEIYTDASYCTAQRLATCGYLTIVNGRKHEHVVYTMQGLESSGEAELYAIILALKYVPMRFSKVTLISDYLPVINYLNGKDSFGKYGTNKALKAYGEQLTGAINSHRVNGNIFTYAHVKGHCPTGGYRNRINEQVDNACRTRLRQERQFYKPQYPQL